MVHGHRRMVLELSQLARLEMENKFILEQSTMGHFGLNQTPPRFNNTTVPAISCRQDSQVIRGRILPKSEPYCRASFLVQITLPPEYPFRAPELIFSDPIYHPSVDESGKHCCCWFFGNADTFNPTRNLTQLITCVLDIIDNIHPSSDHMVLERAAEYRSNHSRFYQKALKQTLSYGRPRYWFLWRAAANIVRAF